jgi:hypothetical protein
MTEQLQKLRRLLHRVPVRIVSLLLLVPLSIGVWLATKIFPGMNRQTVALVGAFMVALVFAFNWGGRRS